MKSNYEKQNAKLHWRCEPHETLVPVEKLRELAKEILALPRADASPGTIDMAKLAGCTALGVRPSSVGEVDAWHPATVWAFLSALSDIACYSNPRSAIFLPVRKDVCAAWKSKLGRDPGELSRIVLPTPGYPTSDHLAACDVLQDTAKKLVHALNLSLYNTPEWQFSEFRVKRPPYGHVSEIDNICVAFSEAEQEGVEKVTTLENVIAGLRGEGVDVMDFASVGTLTLRNRYGAKKSVKAGCALELPDAPADRVESLACLPVSADVLEGVFDWSDNDELKSTFGDLIDIDESQGAVTKSPMDLYDDLTHYRDVTMERALDGLVEYRDENGFGPPEIMEYWRVGDRAYWLEEIRETVIEFGGAKIWGRRCTGMQIAYTEVPLLIGMKQELLPGLEHSWVSVSESVRTVMFDTLIARSPCQV